MEEIHYYAVLSVSAEPESRQKKERLAHVVEIYFTIGRDRFRASDAFTRARSRARALFNCSREKFRMHINEPHSASGYITKRLLFACVLSSSCSPDQS